MGVTKRILDWEVGRSLPLRGGGGIFHPGGWLNFHSGEGVCYGVCQLYMQLCHFSYDYVVKHCTNNFFHLKLEFIYSYDVYYKIIIYSKVHFSLHPYC